MRKYYRCNSAYRLRYWNLRGGELWSSTTFGSCNSAYRLRYWNFRVDNDTFQKECQVATVLTACGIETLSDSTFSCSISAVATVLTACGIETMLHQLHKSLQAKEVATVLTACGIETIQLDSFLVHSFYCCNSAYRLRYWNVREFFAVAQLVGVGCNSAYRLRYWNKQLSLLIPSKKDMLQQCLPLAVLKPMKQLTSNRVKL